MLVSISSMLYVDDLNTTDHTSIDLKIKIKMKIKMKIKIKSNSISPPCSRRDKYQAQLSPVKSSQVKS